MGDPPVLFQKIDPTTNLTDEETSTFGSPFTDIFFFRLRIDEKNNKKKRFSYGMQWPLQVVTSAAYPHPRRLWHWYVIQSHFYVDVIWYPYPNSITISGNIDNILNTIYVLRLNNQVFTTLVIVELGILLLLNILPFSSFLGTERPEAYGWTDGRHCGCRRQRGRENICQWQIDWRESRFGFILGGAEWNRIRNIQRSRGTPCRYTSIKLLLPSVVGPLTIHKIKK